VSISVNLREHAVDEETNYTNILWASHQLWEHPVCEDTNYTNILWASASTWYSTPLDNSIKTKPEAERAQFLQLWSVMHSNKNKARPSVRSRSVTAVQGNNCRHHVHPITALCSLSWTGDSAVRMIIAYVRISGTTIRHHIHFLIYRFIRDMELKSIDVTGREGLWGSRMLSIPVSRQWAHRWM
jgi:hypothetical protein